MENNKKGQNRKKEGKFCEVSNFLTNYYAKKKTRIPGRVEGLETVDQARERWLGEARGHSRRFGADSRFQRNSGGFKGFNGFKGASGDDDMHRDASMTCFEDFAKLVENASQMDLDRFQTILDNHKEARKRGGVGSYTTGAVVANHGVERVPSELLDDLDQFVENELNKAANTTPAGPKKPEKGKDQKKKPKSGKEVGKGREEKETLEPVNFKNFKEREESGVKRSRSGLAESSGGGGGFFFGGFGGKALTIDPAKLERARKMFQAASDEKDAQIQKEKVETSGLGYSEAKTAPVEHMNQTGGSGFFFGGFGGKALAIDPAKLERAKEMFQAASDEKKIEAAGREELEPVIGEIGAQTTPLPGLNHARSGSGGTGFFFGGYGGKSVSIDPAKLEKAKKMFQNATQEKMVESLKKELEPVKELSNETGSQSKTNKQSIEAESRPSENIEEKGTNFKNFGIKHKKIKEETPEHKKKSKNLNFNNQDRLVGSGVSLPLKSTNAADNFSVKGFNTAGFSFGFAGGAKQLEIDPDAMKKAAALMADSQAQDLSFFNNEKGEKKISSTMDSMIKDGFRGSENNTIANPVAIKQSKFPKFGDKNNSKNKPFLDSSITKISRKKDIAGVFANTKQPNTSMFNKNSKNLKFGKNGLKHQRKRFKPPRAIPRLKRSKLFTERSDSLPKNAQSKILKKFKPNEKTGPNGEKSLQNYSRRLLELTLDLKMKFKFNRNHKNAKNVPIPHHFKWTSQADSSDINNDFRTFADIYDEFRTILRKRFDILSEIDFLEGIQGFIFHHLELKSYLPDDSLVTLSSITPAWIKHQSLMITKKFNAKFFKKISETAENSTLGLLEYLVNSVYNRYRCETTLGSYSSLLKIFMKREMQANPIVLKVLKVDNLGFSEPAQGSKKGRVGHSGPKEYSIVLTDGWYLVNFKIADHGYSGIKRLKGSSDNMNTEDHLARKIALKQIISGVKLRFANSVIHPTGKDENANGDACGSWTISAPFNSISKVQDPRTKLGFCLQNLNKFFRLVKGGAGLVDRMDLVVIHVEGARMRDNKNCLILDECSTPEDGVRINLKLRVVDSIEAEYKEESKYKNRAFIVEIYGLDANLFKYFRPGSRFVLKNGDPFGRRFYYNVKDDLSEQDLLEQKVVRVFTQKNSFEPKYLPQAKFKAMRRRIKSALNLSIKTMVSRLAKAKGYDDLYLVGRFLRYKGNKLLVLVDTFSFVCISVKESLIPEIGNKKFLKSKKEGGKISKGSKVLDPAMICQNFWEGILLNLRAEPFAFYGLRKTKGVSILRKYYHWRGDLKGSKGSVNASKRSGKGSKKEGGGGSGTKGAKKVEVFYLDYYLKGSSSYQDQGLYQENGNFLGGGNQIFKEVSDNLGELKERYGVVYEMVLEDPEIFRASEPR